IDSGIDLKHEDFVDENGYSRVRSYMDFTGEGKDDVIGHGTHVAGIMGGNGAMSDGKYTGMAPGANFKVAKVFGTKGETDESVILAAMKWMSDEASGKVDVINMSLGGPGAANKDPLSSMANHLMVKDDILVVTAAGNEGPFQSSIGSPGNARYGLTVGGVDKKGVPVFFSSRGPVRDENGNPIYPGVDIVAYSGDVDLSAIQQQIIMVDGTPVMVVKDPETGKLAAVAAPEADTCVYGPGITAPASSADPDQICRIDGNPYYRKMSGTSQATPQAAGIATLIEDVANRSGVDPSAFEVKAVMMETAQSVGHRRETEGAGLINGRRIAETVMDRVKRGIPIGNIAYMLAMRLTSLDIAKLPQQERYRMTDLGLLDTSTGYLIKDEVELDQAIREIRAVKPMLYVKETEISSFPTGPIPV
ncbi:MAG: S8 family serine peptidase, partial [Elusimicrobiota bacterium]